MVFWDAGAEVGVPTSFQISLAASITFTLEIYLSKNENPILIKHPASEDGCTTKGSVRTMDLGDISRYREAPIELDANLRWGMGDVLIFHGTIQSEVP